MSTVTLEDARTAIQKVVAGREDFRYTDGRDIERKCSYVGDNPRVEEPGCIIGTALFALGVPYAVLSELDTIGDSIISDERVLFTLGAHGYDLNEDVVAYFDAIQWEQDRGSVWGLAVNSAEQALIPEEDRFEVKF